MLYYNILYHVMLYYVMLYYIILYYIILYYTDDYENINIVNPLYLIIGEIDVFIEESNGNKYLTFASTEENKEVLK